MMSVRCVAQSPRKKPEGSICGDSQDCAAGLGCSRDKLCVPFCHVDADCRGRGKCVAYRDETTGKDVAGAATCSRWCDPFQGAQCDLGSTCYVTGLRDPDPHATCRALLDDQPKARGEPCATYNDCEPLLSCAQFGPEVCTSVCRSAADCPNTAPHCYTQFTVPLIWAPDMPVGQCIVWPCDDASVGTPPLWSEGPVWTAVQFTACANRCGPSRDCFRRTCPNAAQWGTCVDRVVAACGGKPGGACRAEYVAMSCSDVTMRSGKLQQFNDCLQRQTDCLAEADETCAAQP